MGDTGRTPSRAASASSPPSPAPSRRTTSTAEASIRRTAAALWAAPWSWWVALPTPLPVPETADVTSGGGAALVRGTAHDASEWGAPELAAAAAAADWEPVPSIGRAGSCRAEVGSNHRRMSTGRQRSSSSSSALPAAPPTSSASPSMSATTIAAAAASSPRVALAGAASGLVAQRAASACLPSALAAAPLAPAITASHSASSSDARGSAGGAEPPPRRLCRPAASGLSLPPQPQLWREPRPTVSVRKVPLPPSEVRPGRSCSASRPLLPAASSLPIVSPSSSSRSRKTSASCGTRAAGKTSRELLAINLQAP